MKYILSPEFHRQLWLRFSPLRLVAAPVVMVLVALATFQLPKDVLGIEQVDVTATLHAARTIFFLSVIVWGSYEAATAIPEEIRANTWDFQRMSSIGPAQLALGKLFGAVSYTWYFGLMALAVFGYAYFNFHAPEVFYGKASPMRQSALPEPADDTLYVLFCLIAAGVLGQSIAFLHSFADNTILFGRTGRSKPPRGIFSFILGAFTGGAAYEHILGNEALHLQPRAHEMLYHFTINWYGYEFSRQGFVAASLLFFIFWFLCGSYRIARAELLYRNLPFAWMAFVATLIGWDNGLTFWTGTGSEVHFFHILWSAFTQALFIAYFCMILEAGDTRRYARFAYYAKRGNVMRALENTTKWMATVPIVLVLFVAVLALSEESRPPFDAPHAAALMVSMMLFALRDGCAIHAINLTFRGRGTSFATLMYFLLVYGLLPAVLLTSLHFDIPMIVKSFMQFQPPENVTRIGAAFYPTAMVNPVLNILPALGETLLAVAWLYRCITRKDPPAAPSKAPGA